MTRERPSRKDDFFFLNSTDKWGDLRVLETGGHVADGLCRCERNGVMLQNDLIPLKPSSYTKRETDKVRERERPERSTKDIKSEKCNLVVPGFRGHVKEVGRVAGSHASGNSLFSSLSQFILFSAFTFRSLFSRIKVKTQAEV